MKNIINLLITFLISTTMCFARTSEVEMISQMSEQIEVVSNLDINTFSNMNEKHLAKAMRFIDRAIMMAKVQNEFLSETMIRLENDMDYLFSRKEQTINKILKTERSIARHYKKAKRYNPALTIAEYKESLQSAIDQQESTKQKEIVLSNLQNAGSYVKFLESFKKSLKSKFTEEKGRLPSSSDWIQTSIIILIWALIIGVVIAVGYFIGWSVIFVALGTIALWALLGFVILVIVLVTMDFGSINIKEFKRKSPFPEDMFAQDMIFS